MTLGTADNVAAFTDGTTGVSYVLVPRGNQYPARVTITMEDDTPADLTNRKVESVAELITLNFTQTTVRDVVTNSVSNLSPANVEDPLVRLRIEKLDQSVFPGQLQLLIPAFLWPLDIDYAPNPYPCAMIHISVEDTDVDPPPRRVERFGIIFLQTPKVPPVL